MQTNEQAAARREYAHDLFRKAGIFVTDAEKEQIETADFGLDGFERTGLHIDGFAMAIDADDGIGLFVVCR